MYCQKEAERKEGRLREGCESQGEKNKDLEDSSRPTKSLSESRTQVVGQMLVAVPRRGLQSPEHEHGGHCHPFGREIPFPMAIKI